MTTHLRRPRLRLRQRLHWLARFHRVGFWLLLIAWTIALEVPVPKQTASEVLGGESGMFWFGKSLHVGMYALLAGLGGTLILSRRQRWLLVTGLVLHGCLTEYFQQFVNRGASWRDVRLDCLGIAIGTLIAWRWRMQPDTTEPRP